MRDLRLVLQDAGFTVAKSTVFSWLTKFRKSQEEVTKPGTPLAPTWEQVIETVPDKQTLAALVLDGLLNFVNETLSERDRVKVDLDKAIAIIEDLRTQVKTITEDRANVMQQLNYHLRKVQEDKELTEEARATLLRKPRW